MAHHPSLLIVPAAFLLADDATFSFLFCSPSTHFCISLSGWDLAKSLPARFIFPNSKILLASRVRHLLMPLLAGQFCSKIFLCSQDQQKVQQEVQQKVQQEVQQKVQGFRRTASFESNSFHHKVHYTHYSISCKSSAFHFQKLSELYHTVSIYIN